jgi:hypothetical protein
VADGVELLYSFSKNEPLENLRLIVAADDSLASISDLYFNAFVFENETHDLFGVQFEGIVIDFGGKFYAVSVPTPMNPSSKAAAGAFTVIRRDAPAAASGSVGQDGATQDNDAPEVASDSAGQSSPAQDSPAPAAASTERGCSWPSAASYPLGRNIQSCPSRFILTSSSKTKSSLRPHRRWVLFTAAWNNW